MGEVRLIPLPRREGLGEGFATMCNAILTPGIHRAATHHTSAGDARLRVINFRHEPYSKRHLVYTASNLVYWRTVLTREGLKNTVGL